MPNHSAVTASAEASALAAAQVSTPENADSSVQLTLDMPGSIDHFVDYKTIAKSYAANKLGCAPSDIELLWPQAVWAPERLVVTVIAAGSQSSDDLLSHPPGSVRFWKRSVRVMLVLIALFAILGFWQNQQLANQTDATNKNLTILQQQSKIVAPDLPHTASPLSQTYALVHRDLNPLLTTLETVQITGVSLQQVSADQSQQKTSQQVTVTYNIAHPTQVDAVMHQLRSTDSHNWRLQQLSDKQTTFLGTQK